MTITEEDVRAVLLGGATEAKVKNSRSERSFGSP